jgi:hypothetical protein
MIKQLIKKPSFRLNTEFILAAPPIYTGLSVGMEMIVILLASVVTALFTPGELAALSFDGDDDTDGGGP